MQFYSSLNSDIEFEAPFEDLVTQVVNPANVLILLESSSKIIKIYWALPNIGALSNSLPSEIGKE